MGSGKAMLRTSIVTLTFFLVTEGHTRTIGDEAWETYVNELPEVSTVGIEYARTARHRVRGIMHNAKRA